MKETVLDSSLYVKYQIGQQAYWRPISLSFHQRDRPRLMIRRSGA